MTEPLLSAPDQTLVEAYERGAERLSEAVFASCEPTAAFPRRLHNALAAALDFCAAEPELGRLLTTRPFGEAHEQLLPLYNQWRDRYAELLRDAAAASPDTLPQPPFLEPVMIAGIYFCISCRLRDESQEERPLRSLLPDLQASVLSYYSTTP